MKVNLGRYPKDHTKPRKLEVKIDNWDIWGLDHTLALIIHPALVYLKENKQGAPDVDDSDVPDALKSTSASTKESEHDTDDNFFKRWDYVLDEMIWAFSQHTNDDWDIQFTSGQHDITWKPVEINGQECYEMERGPNDTYVYDHEAAKLHYERMQRGTILFGKYYKHLWD